MSGIDVPFKDTNANVRARFHGGSDTHRTHPLSFYRPVHDDMALKLEVATGLADLQQTNQKPHKRTLSPLVRDPCVRG